MTSPRQYAKGKEYNPVENPTWRDLQSNPYMHKPTAEMLTEEGHKVHDFFRIRGQAKGDPPIYVEVLFDRAFVINWLQKRMGALLTSLPYNELQKLLKEAKDASQSKAH
jgi:hypothetical protein